MRFGEDVKSLTVKGDPSGIDAFFIAKSIMDILFITYMWLFRSIIPALLSISYLLHVLEDLLPGPQVLCMEVRLGV